MGLPGVNGQMVLKHDAKRSRQKTSSYYPLVLLHALALPGSMVALYTRELWSVSIHRCEAVKQFLCDR